MLALKTKPELVELAAGATDEIGTHIFEILDKAVAYFTPITDVLGCAMARFMSAATVAERRNAAKSGEAS